MIPDRVWQAEADAAFPGADWTEAARWKGRKLCDLDVNGWAEVWTYLVGHGLTRVRPRTLLAVWAEARRRSVGHFGSEGES